MSLKQVLISSNKIKHWDIKWLNSKFHTNSNSHIKISFEIVNLKQDCWQNCSLIIKVHQPIYGDVDRKGCYNSTEIISFPNTYGLRCSINFMYWWDYSMFFGNEARKLRCSIFSCLLIKKHLTSCQILHIFCGLISHFHQSESVLPSFFCWTTWLRCSKPWLVSLIGNSGWERISRFMDCSGRYDIVQLHILNHQGSSCHCWIVVRPILAGIDKKYGGQPYRFLTIQQFLQLRI